jgi:hypothetical protein
VEYAETAYWLALLCAEDLDRAVAKRELYRLTIVEHHLLSELAGRTVTELAGLLPGLSESEAARWASALAAVASASDELGAQRSHGVDLITRADPVYPENLAERLPEQKLPYLLFYRGNLALLDRPAVYVAVPKRRNPAPRCWRTRWQRCSRLCRWPVWEATHRVSIGQRCLTPTQPVAPRCSSCPLGSITRARSCAPGKRPWSAAIGWN